MQPIHDATAPDPAPKRLVTRARRGWRQNLKPESLRTAVRLNGNTIAGRALVKFRAGLIEQLGGALTPAQKAMVDLCCQLQARLIVMDHAFAEAGGLTAHDSRTYLAWANALARHLRELGAQGKAKPKTDPPTLAELHSRVAAAKRS